MIRCSIGIEEESDILRGFKQALEQL